MRFVKRSLLEATGYNRKYAIALLSKAPAVKTSRRRARTSKYGTEVIDTICQLWKAANGICAKRLLPFLPTLIETLERCGHLKLNKRLKKVIRVRPVVPVVSIWRPAWFAE